MAIKNVAYGYKKCGTRAQMCPTPAHGNSKNEIEEEDKPNIVKRDRRKVGTK